MSVGVGRVVSRRGLILTAGWGIAGGGSGFWSGVGSSVVGSSGRDLTYGRSGLQVGLLWPIARLCRLPGPFLRTVLPSLGWATFMRCGAWRLTYGWIAVPPEARQLCSSD